MPMRKPNAMHHEYEAPTRRAPRTPRGYGVGTLAARLAIVMMSSAAPTLTAATHADEVVLKDHTVSAWDGIVMGHSYSQPGSGMNNGSAVMFQGNGGVLQKVGIVWAHAGAGGVPNGGSPLNWNWRFVYWPSTEAYLLDLWGDEPNPENPSIVHTFSNPTNPDWYDQIGLAGQYKIYYAEVDVAFLNIQLPDGGEEVHAMLVPDPPGPAATALGRLAFSHGNGAVGTHDDWFVSAQMGPDTLHNLNAPQDWSAYRVTASADCETEIPGDLNGDGVVDVSDLLILLAAWGPCPRSGDCTGDVNEDGTVDVSDLLLLLSNWG